MGCLATTRVPSHSSKPSKRCLRSDNSASAFVVAASSEKSGKFLEGLDMASPHEIAPHDCNSHLNEGVRGFFEMETRVMLSVIDIDDGQRYQALNRLPNQLMRGGGGCSDRKTKRPLESETTQTGIAWGTPRVAAGISG